MIGDDFMDVAMEIGYDHAQIDKESAKFRTAHQCRLCGHTKEFTRQWVSLCESCSDDLLLKATSYGGEPEEIIQRHRDYIKAAEKAYVRGLGF